MSRQAIINLIVETVRDPRSAANKVVASDFSRETLWTALGLVVVLNALVFSASITLFPPTPEQVMMMPIAYHSPVSFTMLLGGVIVLTIFTIFWAGRAMGGQGSMAAVIASITWLHFMRLLVQVAVVVLSVLSAGLAGLLALIAGLYGIYIFLNFIDVVHRFNSLGKTAGVVIVAFLGMGFGLFVIMGLIGFSAMGMR